MGDIKRIRKKYQTPRHPYNEGRIENERYYKQRYGLRNKKELWKAESLLKGFKDQIKRFPSMEPNQAAIEKEKLRARLVRLGLIQEETPLGDVLGMDTSAILDRRLQSMVLDQDLARTISQARQMIVHEHIKVGGRTVNAPSYLVPLSEEDTIEFSPKSPFFNELHPERVEDDSLPQKPAQPPADEEEPEVVDIDEEDEDDE